MKTKITTGAGTFVAAACCFGLLNLIFGALGLTAAVAAINNYGDYVFFPAYALFGTLFVLSLPKNWFSYILMAIVAALGIYFMIFGFVYAGLIIGGAVLGGLVYRWLKK